MLFIRPAWTFPSYEIYKTDTVHSKCPDDNALPRSLFTGVTKWQKLKLYLKMKFYNKMMFYMITVYPLLLIISDVQVKSPHMFMHDSCLHSLFLSESSVTSEIRHHMPCDPQHVILTFKPTKYQKQVLCCSSKLENLPSKTPNFLLLAYIFGCC